MGELWRRLTFLFRRKRMDRELDEEMRAHYEMRGGQRCQFGNLTLWKEASREAWGFTWLETLWQDLRYAARLLRRSPGFTAAAVLSLGLGIGANTAIFSLIDAILLRSLPVRNPHELVALAKLGRFGRGGFSYPLFTEFRDRNQVFSGTFATGAVGQTTIGVDAGPENATRELVSGDYFTVLGVPAAQGRTFTAEDDKVPGGHPIAVISDRFWLRRFGRDPGIVGRSITVDDTPVTIIGVTAPEFFGIEVGNAVDIWMPTMMQAKSWLTNPGFNWLGILARRKPGVSEEQAAAAMKVLFEQHLQQAAANAPERERRGILEVRLEMEPAANGVSRLRQQFSEPLRILMAVVGLVLLIACANVANLLLARAAAREREIAVRLAVGAARGRLVRQLLTESVLLSLLGGTLGLLFALWGTRFLLAFVPSGAAPLVLAVKPDPRILGFTAIVSILAGILFGLSPALGATSPHLRVAPSTRRPFALSRLLIVSQVALSVLLLFGAGLFARSLRNLRTLDPGFRRENVVTFSLNLPRGYKATDLNQQVLERLASLPGVQGVSLSWPGPFRGGRWAGDVTPPGYIPRPDENIEVDKLTVAPRFFETMGIRRLEGRDFTFHDGAAAPKVAIINESLARYYLGSQSPIGKTLVVAPSPEPIEIVGVVQDAKYQNFREKAPRAIYFSFLQQGDRGATFALRAARNPSALANALRAEIEAVDKRVTLGEVRSLDRAVDDYLAQERLIATLSGFFGVLALVLASVGLYGVMSYAVARRTVEIGVRMALGAGRRDVLWLVLRGTLVLILAGVLLGTPAALAASRLVSSYLFGLTAADPKTMASAVTLLLAVGTLAGYLPARRAAKVDPMAALKYE